MAEPRRLRGHKATVTSCVASRDHPGFVATAAEDGCVCYFDLRCKDVTRVLEIGPEPVTSLCFKTGNEDILYVSSGNGIRNFDMRMESSSSPLKIYNYNKDEINQICCNSKAAFIGSSDDSGDIKIIDINQHCLYKTLRAGHTSICSSVQFIPWTPWEVITGGLDSKLIMWNFSKGRPIKIIDFGLPDMKNANNTAQCLNPAFVHAIAVPALDMLEVSGKICVVARGDGIVEVIDIESELAVVGSKNSRKGHKTFQAISKVNGTVSGTGTADQDERNRLHLDYTLGGHNAAVSCVGFSLFGQRGRFIVSGGNDKSVKVWDYSSYYDAVGAGNNNNVMHLNIDLSKKVNWLCTTPNDSENLVVCDTTKVVKVYSVS